MPCSDVTEILFLQLGANDQIEDYSLNKRTCGRAVGETDLILDWLKGKPIEDFLKIDVEDFLDHFACEDETEEFLYLKHFFALQAAGQSLLGWADSHAEATCAVESVGYDEEGTELKAQISISVLTEKIKSCGRCSGCGSKKRAKVPS